MIENKNGWEISEKNGNAYLIEYQKTFPDGLSVVIKILKDSDAYKVISESESRTSGPTLVDEGIFPSMELTMQKVKVLADEWDELNDEEINTDWSKWKIKDE